MIFYYLAAVNKNGFLLVFCLKFTFKSRIPFSMHYIYTTATPWNHTAPADMDKDEKKFRYIWLPVNNVF